MSRSKWTIRNYNAFVRDSRQKYDLSLSDARQMYRTMRERLKRSLYAVDLKRHPRISRESASVSHIEQRPTVSYAGEEIEDRDYIRVTTAEQWIDNYDDWIDEFDDIFEEWESTADYEETP